MFQTADNYQEWFEFQFTPVTLHSPRASTRKLHGFKGKAQTVELFLPMYFFTSSANFPLLLFEIRQIEIWFFFEWNSADSISKGWICFCLQFYVLAFGVTRRVFAFWHVFLAFTSSIVSKIQKAYKNTIFHRWFFNGGVFLAQPNLLLLKKEGEILTSKGPDHGWLCQQHTTWLQASRFPSCKFFVHNWVLYLWSFRERGKDLPKWHHRPDRPCCLACRGLQHGLGLESWS